MYCSTLMPILTSFDVISFFNVRMYGCIYFIIIPSNSYPSLDRDHILSKGSTDLVWCALVRVGVSQGAPSPDWLGLSPGAWGVSL